MVVLSGWTMPNRSTRESVRRFRSSWTAIVIQPEDRSRIADSVELALSLGIGVLQIAIADDEDREEPLWQMSTHSQHLVCGCCGRSFTDLTPHHFSFNTGNWLVFAVRRTGDANRNEPHGAGDIVQQDLGRRGCFALA